MARLTKKYNLSAAQAEAKLKHPMIEIELGAGEDKKPVSVLIEPPQLWPDEIVELSRQGKLTEASQLLLGDQFATWKQHGGTNALLNLIIEEHTKKPVGESSAS